MDDRCHSDKTNDVEKITALSAVNGGESISRFAIRGTVQLRIVHVDFSYLTTKIPTRKKINIPLYRCFFTKLPKS